MKNTETVEWKRPELEEIPLSCEISTYSNAEMPEEI
jgi:hypothetical protein